IEIGCEELPSSACREAIASEALPSEGRAWSMLASARRTAPAGSQERADLDWLVAFARSAAALGRPEGRRATARRALRVNAWWFARRPSPGERVIARVRDGVILTYKRGHGFMVNPVATMGRWRGLNEHWSAALLAESMLPMLTERTHDGREWAALEYFDVPGDRSVVRPGVSGMGQARAVSLFAKAWAETGDPRHLTAADRVLRSFEVPVDSGGVRASVPDPDGGAPGTWFPERAYPDQPAWTGAALNGFMVTLIELRRAEAALGRAGSGASATEGPATSTPVSTAPTSTAPAPHAAPARPPGTDAAGPDASEVAARARSLADRGLRSLVRFLPLHDSGTWSYYGLLTPGKPWRSYLADLNYHCYHVSLLRSLDALYPGEALAATASRWQAYVDERGAKCPAR
ncbi:MAG: D-glucuronyl C5-epimerase family protein, partial [Actinomycetota bacterium]